MKHRHAYLIIAHGSFDVLRVLLEALDDIRNDVYIHFDGKLEQLPTVRMEKAGLYILNERVKVYWGDVSQIKAEYALFETAFYNGVYSYYHLLSGVDFPLKSQDYIHQFFLNNEGKELIGFSQYNVKKEVERKVGRYHLYPRSFRNNSLYKRILRSTFLRMQELFGMKRNGNVGFRKGANWSSMSAGFIEYLIPMKSEVFKMYKNSFCADEIYKQTVCWNSPFRLKVFNSEDEAKGIMRAVKWKGRQVFDWTIDDYEFLVQSEFLFGRKFSDDNIEVVNKVFELIKPKAEL